jgi:hypothetical protein
MTETFIQKARDVHGDRYDYYKVDYKNCNTKVIIICKEHGEFYKTPSKHINAKQGCAKCSGKYKPTTEEIIERARSVHGDKFDYSKSIYVKGNAKIIIICKEHSDFEQTPSNHIRFKQGCPKCVGRNKGSQEFIKDARLVHGDTYDYSNVDYKKCTIKVTIICKEHGDFEQMPYSHLDGHGCPCCAVIIRSNNKRKTLEEFIENAMSVHGNKYDYSQVDYIASDTKITIICKEHGEFEQTPNNHFIQKQGCPICGVITTSNKTRKSTEKYIKDAKLVHGYRYDYSEVNYKSNHTKITIICKEHGKFEQDAGNHLRGANCYECSLITNSEKRKRTLEEFIDRSNIEHNNKYDYSESIYVNGTTKLKIICKIHGVFEQTPDSHIIQGSGCLECSRISSAKKRTLNIDDFLKKSRLVHKDKYDYSKVNIIFSDIPVIIICKIHGEFMKTPIAHYNSCRGCPKCANNGYSKPQIKWLDFLSKYYNIDIQHAENDGEYVILGSKYNADGFCKENNTIYEFHGDYWHGNPIKFDPDDINEITKKTFKELYDKTLIRENKIKELGYNLVTIWEYDWKKINRCIKILQNKFRKYQN